MKAVGAALHMVGGGAVPSDKLASKRRFKEGGRGIWGRRKGRKRPQKSRTLKEGALGKQWSSSVQRTSGFPPRNETRKCAKDSASW